MEFGKTRRSDASSKKRIDREDPRDWVKCR